MTIDSGTWDPSWMTPGHSMYGNNRLKRLIVGAGGMIEGDWAIFGEVPIEIPLGHLAQMHSLFEHDDPGLLRRRIEEAYHVQWPWHLGEFVAPVGAEFLYPAFREFTHSPRIRYAATPSAGLFQVTEIGGGNALCTTLTVTPLRTLEYFMNCKIVTPGGQTILLTQEALREMILAVEAADDDPNIAGGKTYAAAAEVTRLLRDLALGNGVSASSTGFAPYKIALPYKSAAVSDQGNWLEF